MLAAQRPRLIGAGLVNLAALAALAALASCGRSDSGALTLQAEPGSPFLRVASSAVEALTGRWPRSLQDLLEANAARLRTAVQ